LAAREEPEERMERGLIFDCDGVLADTELHGHLVAFNQMWKKLGVRWEWSPEQYAEKLKIGGGKERMASLFLDQDFHQVFAVPESEEDRKALITRWHKEKTAFYQQIISSGAIPALCLLLDRRRCPSSTGPKTACRKIEDSQTPASSVIFSGRPTKTECIDIISVSPGQVVGSHSI